MATNEERLIEAIRQLASFSVVDDVMPEMLTRIAVLANDTIDCSTMVGLTMEADGRLGTPVFTDEAAPEIDSAQYVTGIGPCVDAFHHGVVHAIPSTPKDDRWRPFSETCQAHGILSTVSIPVKAKDECVGALNFYSRTEGGFDAKDVTLAEAFAAQAAIVIANARAYWSVKALAEQLAQALETRIIIEQAKGVLIAGGHTSDAAFASLRRSSQRENRKIHLVAADVVSEAERRAASSEG